MAVDREAIRSFSKYLGAKQERIGERLAAYGDFDPDSPPDSDVPDPYYGGPRGFEIVFDLCEAGCRGLLDKICRDHGLVR